MNFWEIIFYIFSSLAILSVFIPFIRNDFWVFRIFDYPRFQKLIIIAVFTVIGTFFIFKTGDWYNYLVFSILLFCLIYLIYKVVPYTPLGKEMLEKADKKHSEEKLTILVANVYQENKNYRKTLDLIRLRKADIVFLVETSQDWMNGVQELKKDYPYFVEVPQENTYGLLLYSKYKLINPKVEFLVDKEIPSVITDIDFEGRKIKLFGLHPTPPVPQENPESTDRDAEILIIGKMAKKCNYPVIVMGDLNDVAWSYSTKLFLKISGLLDPRRGRGMYSTFHAKYPVFRWPLDHFFVSSHFRLLNMKVEKSVDSDHFPISISLVLRKEDKEQELEATQQDKELAEEKIEKAFE